MHRIPCHRNATSLRFREHRLLFQMEMPNKIDAAQKAKEAADKKINAPRERMGKSVKNAQDVMTQATGALEQSMKGLISFSNRLNAPLQISEDDKNKAAVALRSYNRTDPFSKELVKSQLTLYKFAEPSDAVFEQAYQNAMREPPAPVSPPLQPGSTLSMIAGGLSMIGTVLAKIGLRKNIVNERQTFTNQFAALQKEFANTAILGLVTQQTSEQLTVNMKPRPGQANNKTATEAFVKQLAIPSNGFQNTDYEVNSGIVTIKGITPARLQQVRTVLMAPGVRHPLDDAETVKKQEADKKTEAELKKKTNEDEKKARDEATTAIREAEVTLETASDAPEQLRKELMNRLDALRKAVNDVSATPDAIRKALALVQQMRTNFNALRTSWETATKALQAVRDRTVESTNGDVFDPGAARALKIVNGCKTDLETAQKGTDAGRIDTAKSALEKAMTGLEDACKVVRKTWGHTYLINNVNATSEGVQGDVDRYSKQMGWTLMGDFMGMQWNRTQGQWQTGWWNGGRGPMDSPAGAIAFNYANYDKINSTLQKINVDKKKPPTSGLE